MNEPDIERWTLMRDMLVFQVKLAIDAIRDLFLSPVSIICGVVDIFIGNSLSKSYFYKLMGFGHQTDSWLNLFGRPKKDTENLNALGTKKAKTDMNVDELFSQVESLLKAQHDKGGLTASTKATIDRYLNKIVETKTSSDKKK
jgi:hypothetical protein